MRSRVVGLLFIYPNPESILSIEGRSSLPRLTGVDQRIDEELQLNAYRQLELTALEVCCSRDIEETLSNRHSYMGKEDTSTRRQKEATS